MRAVRAARRHTHAARATHPARAIRTVRAGAPHTARVAAPAAVDVGLITVARAVVARRVSAHAAGANLARAAAVAEAGLAIRARAARLRPAVHTDLVAVDLAVGAARRRALPLAVAIAARAIARVSTRRALRAGAAAATAVHVRLVLVFRRVPARRGLTDIAYALVARAVRRHHAACAVRAGPARPTAVGVGLVAVAHAVIAGRRLALHRVRTHGARAVEARPAHLARAARPAQPAAVHVGLGLSLRAVKAGQRQHPQRPRRREHRQRVAGHAAVLDDVAGDRPRRLGVIVPSAVRPEVAVVLSRGAILVRLAARPPDEVLADGPSAHPTHAIRRHGASRPIAIDAEPVRSRAPGPRLDPVAAGVVSQVTEQVAVRIAKWLVVRVAERVAVRIVGRAVGQRRLLKEVPPLAAIFQAFGPGDPAPLPLRSRVCGPHPTVAQQLPADERVLGRVGHGRQISAQPKVAPALGRSSRRGPCNISRYKLVEMPGRLQRQASLAQ